MIKHLMNGSSLIALATFAPEKGAGSKAMSKTDQQTVKAVRNVFQESQSRPVKITNEMILSLFNHDAWDNLDDEGRIALLIKAEGETAKVSISDPGISALVSKLDDQFEVELTDCIHVEMKKKTTALHMYAQMKRIFTKDELDAMPIPGTEKEHVEGTNRLPDVIKTTDKATGSPITTVWWNDFVSTMPRGKEYESALADAQKEIKAIGSVPALKGKSQDQLKEIVSDNTARRNALRSMMKRAAEFHHAFEAVKSMPHVDIKLRRAQASKGALVPITFGAGTLGKDAIQVTAGPKPLWLSPKGEPDLGREVSITQLTNMDIEKALKAPDGGTVADLVATLKTGGQTPEAGAKDVDIDMFVAGIHQFAAFVNKRENMATIMKKINTKENGEFSPESNDLLESVCSMVLLCKPVYDKNKGRYDALQNKEEEEKAAVA